MGRYESNPPIPAGGRTSRNGMWWAPSQIHIATRIGSEVFPLLLPAVAQASREIKAVGRRKSATLRKACVNETQRTRWNIDYPFKIARIKRAVSLGVEPTCTPAASNASFFPCAVPEDPETMAPACPMVLPSGAVNPAT